MKWRRVSKKDQGEIVDIRGAGRRAGRGAGGLPIPGGIGTAGGGVGLIVVLAVLAFQLLGGGSGFDLSQVLAPGASLPGAGTPEPIPREQDPDRDLKDFSSYVFVNAQDTWEQSFRRAGSRYQPAKLVLYSQAVRTDGCGSATSAVGPFYCPADSRVYLDLTFYADMERELGASGDFAWAYVIAHEIGHHVQSVVGTNAEVGELQRSNPSDANELSVRLELQADCYAGIWAATVYAEGNLEEGDLDEAFAAAEAIGDDRLQRQAGRQVNPDTFTHGTSEQRKRWFERGYSSADPSACDTFSPDEI